MAIVIDEPSGYEVLLNYALFAGAIFQLICIFAVIILPQKESEKVDETVAALSESQPSVPANKSAHDHNPRRGRKERKKHK